MGGAGMVVQTLLMALDNCTLTGESRMTLVSLSKAFDIFLRHAGFVGPVSIRNSRTVP
jgi:hypothetical protein